MPTLLRAPLIETQAGGRSALVLFVCEPFDEQFSFRALFRELLLPVELPEEKSGEDFVHGQAHWSGTEYALYFERSLGYVQLESTNRQAIEALAASLEPRFSFSA
jgi:hypothetical protein